MIKIDATNRTLGRVATEAASFLLNKNSVEFSKNVVSPEKVEIENAKKTLISEKKKKEMVFVSYTGYPGGIKKETLESLIKRKGIGEVYKKVVYGMLPKNKLRSERIKNLIVRE